MFSVAVFSKQPTAKQPHMAGTATTTPPNNHSNVLPDVGSRLLTNTPPPQGHGSPKLQVPPPPSPPTMKLLTLTPLFLSALASAFTIHGSFAPSALLPNPALLPPSTSLTLTTSGTTKRALAQRDGKFVFRDVPEGSYLLDVQCPTHHFGPLRVDVDHRGDVKVYMTFRGNEWNNMGEKRNYPLVFSPLAYLDTAGNTCANSLLQELQPTRTAEYYIVREGCKLSPSPYPTWCSPTNQVHSQPHKAPCKPHDPHRHCLLCCHRRPPQARRQNGPRAQGRVRRVAAQGWLCANEPHGLP